MDGSHLSAIETTLSVGVDKIVPVIMSGGSGTRLWPLSTDMRPKQFHALGSELSLFQETLMRHQSADGLEILPPILVCNHQHRDVVEAQVAELGCSVTAIVLEPVARNTAAVAAVAASLAQQYYPDALVLLTPADHVIADTAQFRAALGRSLRVARDRIVTFGIKPTAPETGYGYIQSGSEILDGVYEVSRFVEKPSRSKAEAYCLSGDHTWNAGIFLFSADVMITALRTFAPEVLDGALAALAGADRTRAVIALEADAFATAPALSVDIAVMERTTLAAVVPCSIGWADLGCWSEIWRISRQDSECNALRGQVTVQDTSNSLIWSDGPAIAVSGLEDMIVVAANGSIVIVPKSRAQDVKGLLEAVKVLNRDIKGECRI